MRLTRYSRNIKSATNSCNIPAKPRTIKGFGADMSNVIGSFDDPFHELDNERWLDPPEYDDPDVKTWSEVVELDFEDVGITILPDTTWDYRDLEYTWAKSPEGKHGEWHSDKHYSIVFGDPVDMVEYIDDLIVSQLPSTPGDYLISGHAELYFDISEGSYDEYHDATVTDVDFDYDTSRVTNFECKPN